MTVWLFCSSFRRKPESSSQSFGPYRVEHALNGVAGTHFLFFALEERTRTELDSGFRRNDELGKANAATHPRVRTTRVVLQRVAYRCQRASSTRCCRRNVGPTPHRHTAQTRDGFRSAV